RAVARQAFFTPPERRDAAALEAARADVRTQIERLEARAAGRRGRFIVGGEPSRADFTWLPFVEIAGRAGVELDRARIPWLVDWRETMRARPSYERSYPPHCRASADAPRELHRRARAVPRAVAALRRAGHGAQGHLVEPSPCD